MGNLFFKKNISINYSFVLGTFDIFNLHIWIRAVHTNSSFLFRQKPKGRESFSILLVKVGTAFIYGSFSNFLTKKL